MSALRLAQSFAVAIHSRKAHYLSRVSLGHPHKMFRFPSPSLSWRWVGRSGKRKKRINTRRGLIANEGPAANTKAWLLGHFVRNFFRELKQTTRTTATRTSLNKRFHEQTNSCARALWIFVHSVFAVLCKTATSNDQVLLRLRNVDDDG